MAGSASQREEGKTGTEESEELVLEEFRKMLKIITLLMAIKLPYA